MKRVKLKKKAPRGPPLERKRDLLIVNVNEDWRLINDGRQFIIEQRKTRDDDSHYWKVHGYLTTLQMAVRWLGQKQIFLSPGVFDGRALIKMEETLLRIERDVKLAVDAMCRTILADDVFMQEFAKSHMTVPVQALRPAVPQIPVAPIIEEPRVMRRKKIVVPDEYRETNKHGIPKFLEREPKRVRLITKKPPAQSSVEGAGEGQTRSPSPDRGKQGKPPHTTRNAKRKAEK
jgi:hypothetical protein